LADVRLDGLTKHFGNVKAVDNLNLRICDKEFLTLLGPSGCGKTTSMRLIAGLETPTSGNIYIGGKLVNDVPPKDRDVAMVFQSYALYPHMTVYDNISFPLRMRKYAKDEVRKRVRKVCELLQIEELLERKPKQLSGGQQQRVALGRAIVREPKVFLMDEPLSNLDAKLRVYMRAELKNLQKKIGITTVYVTHDQVEAMTMSDRIALMSKGVLQQLGTTHEVYSRPSSTFVAGFLGTPPMNFLSCSFIEENGGGYLDVGSFRYDASELKDAIKSGASSSELILGVRPEDTSLSREKNLQSSIEAKVYVTEPLGSEVIVDLRVGDNIVKVKAPPEFTMNIGEKVWIGFNRDRIHLFDRKTEKAIV